MTAKIHLFRPAPVGAGHRLAGFYIHAGFESPGTDYEEERISMDGYVTDHPEATYYFKVKGDCMEDSGIYEDDLMVLDKSLKPLNGDVVVGVLNGEFIIACYIEMENRRYLMRDNHKGDYPPIKIEPLDEFTLEGVVPYSLLDQRRQRYVRANRLQQLLRQLRAGVPTGTPGPRRRSA